MYYKAAPTKLSFLLVSLICLFTLDLLLHKTSGIQFRGKYNYEIDRGRNLKLQLKKIRVTGRNKDDSIGIILDRPKISILSYRSRSSDPWIISDELGCSSVLASNGGRSSSFCDDVEVDLERNHSGSQNVRLGQGSDEEPEWFVPPNVTQITVKCSSKTGPVEWDYSGLGIFPDIDIDTRRHVGDFWTPTTYVYESRLVLRKVTDQLTGTFTCRNVDKPHILSSFYMFVPQEKLQIFPEGHKIQIIPPSQANEIIIPCRLNSSLEKSVYLYKRTPDGGLRKMNLNRGVRYDPYVGFTVPYTRDLPGHYLCRVEQPMKKKEGRDESPILTRDKREVPLFMTVPPPPPTTQETIPEEETATSPGISAFPTSSELLELMKPSAADPIVRESLEGIPERSLLPPPPMVPGPPMNKPRRRKRPVFMRRRGHPQGEIDPAMFHSRRDSYPQYSQRPMIHRHRLPPHPPPPPRRPLFSRRPPPPPPHLLGPFSHPQSFHQQQFPAPVSQESTIKVVVTNDSLLNSEASSSAASIPASEQNDYMYPSPVISELPELPPAPKPINVLPTFIHKGQQRLRPPHMSFSSSEILHSSAAPYSGEVLSNKPPPPNFPSSGEFLSSRVDSNSNSSSTKNRKPPKRGAAAILSQNILPQTVNIMNSMSCVLKKVLIGPDAPCNGSFFEDVAAASIKRQPLPPGGNPTGSGNRPFRLPFKDTQRTLLEVEITPSPSDKFFPKETVLYTTVPFFVKWQTRFTDYADHAEVNHTLKEGSYKRHKAGVFEDGVNSFEVFNLVPGETGKITVPYMGRNKEILKHSWKFFVVNSTVYDARGLKHKEVNGDHIFTCKSTSPNKPTMKLTKLSEDGCPEVPGRKYDDNEDGDDEGRSYKTKVPKEYKEEDCGSGCSQITTEIESAIVECFGDGVDESIRYPKDSYCTGRPFFVERGKSKNVTIEQTQSTLTLPCVINNRNADVFLFHRHSNGNVEEVTDEAEYDLQVGFTIDLTKISSPPGTYLCTSTVDLEDDTDMVTFHVNFAPKYKFHPETEQVNGVPPFKFTWESSEELEIENVPPVKNYYSGLFAQPVGNRSFVGTFDIETLDKGESGEIKVVRSSDKEVVHVWKYKNIGESKKPGLWLNTKRNVFQCQSSTDEGPVLYPIECPNANVCKLKHRFDETGELGRDNSYCGEGCVQLKVWGNNPTGFVRCRGDGVNESLTYFLSSNNSLLTEKDDLTGFKQPEITNVIRTLRVGETTNFVCKASKYFYSKGFQWAIETKSGSKRFVDLKTKDDDDSYLNEIRSEISLKVGDRDWKAVWCFAPFINSSEWANASQIIYIRS